MTRRSTTSAAASRIRVVHLINHLGYGGSERQLFLVLSHADLDRFEHRVVVFNPSPERVYDAALRALGISVTQVPESCRGAPRRLLWLTRRLRAWRPGVVHSWSVHDNPYAGLAGRLAGVPVRWGSLRGSLSSAGLARQPGWIRWLMLHAVGRLVVNSRALGDEAAAAGLPRRRLLTLPNAVQVRDEDPAVDLNPVDLRAFGIEPDTPVVGTVGNLRPVKDQMLFVRAMARVLAERPVVRALIVGQPIPGQEDYARRLRDEIDRLGLCERVTLTGFRDDVPRILRRLSVLCLTSRTEGMPNAVLEALAAGCPVVATRVGGVAEAVEDGVHGYVVAPGDIEGLARSVGRLLDEPRAAAGMGRAGRAHVRNEFSCDAAARRLERAYLEALGEDVHG